MYNLTEKERKIMRQIIQKMFPDISLPKRLTQNNMSSLNWALFQKYDIIIPELVKFIPEYLDNQYLADVIEKEIAEPLPVENEGQYPFKYNTNIVLLVD